MAKRKRLTSEKSIERHKGEGRGDGRLADYNPWLHIQDVASRGLVTRIKGWKTGRVHHFLSLLELGYFYILEWSLEVYDIREQYPLLPLEETIAIAEACGVKHPTDPRSKHPVVMTTDVVTTIRTDLRDVDQARTLKYAGDLRSTRVLEKLEIERRYWQARKVDWKIVTDEQVPATVAKNVEWFHQYFRLDDFTQLRSGVVTQITSTLTESVIRQSLSLRDITQETDDRLGLEAGTSLAFARYLLANRRWLVNMNQPINPGKPLVLASTPEPER